MCSTNLVLLSLLPRLKIKNLTKRRGGACATRDLMSSNQIPGILKFESGLPLFDKLTAFGKESPYSSKFVFIVLTLIFAASQPSQAKVDISVSADRVELTMDMEAEGYHHYRLDASTNLSQWDAIASMSMHDGQGAHEVLPPEGESMPARSS